MSRSYRGLASLNRSLRLQLVTGIVVILLTVILLLTTVIARFATRVLEQQTSTQLSGLASQSARTVSDFLDARAATVDLWAADSLLLSVVKDPGLRAVFLPGLAGYLTRYAEQEPWIADVYVVADDNLVFSLSGNVSADNASTLLAQLTAPDNPTVQLLATDNTGHNPRLAIRRNVRDRGQMLEGVAVILLLNLQEVQNQLFADSSVGHSGLLTLLAKNGTPLVDMKELAFHSANLHADSRSAINDHFLIETRPVADTPLQVISLADLEIIEAPVWNLIAVISLLGFGSVVVGFLGTVYFTGRVTAPIRQLTSDARKQTRLRFGQQNHYTVAHPPQNDVTVKSIGVSYGEDEVGELAAVFEQLNSTTDQLTEANSLLEKRNTDLDVARSTLRDNLDRLERELNSARTLQMSMVPIATEALIPWPSVRVAATMQPAREVGGDFYDFFAVNEHTLCVLIGDVSDKGTPSALFMARSLSLVRFAVMHSASTNGGTPEPAEIFQQVNPELCKNNSTRMFVTLYLGFLNVQTGHHHYANAGHISPIICSTGGVRQITETSPDMPLGINVAAKYQNHSAQLLPGEQMILFTDGVTDAMNPTREFFGIQRLKHLISRQRNPTPVTMVEAITTGIKSFSQNADQFDDITIVALAHTAHDSPR